MPTRTYAMSVTYSTRLFCEAYQSLKRTTRVINEILIILHYSGLEEEQDGTST